MITVFQLNDSTSSLTLKFSSYACQLQAPTYFYFANKGFVETPDLRNLNSKSVQ